jgi:steroid 5-alpha reductase family enzyme
MNTPQVVTAALVISVLCSLVVWAVSFVRHNAALADRAWPVLIMLCAAVFVAGALPIGTRLGVMLAIGLAWALRLCGHITWRSWGHPEERRYAEMRQRNEPQFAWKSLYLVFVLQAVLAWLVAVPFLAASLGQPAAAPWLWLDSLGAALALFGLLFEAVADAQMAAFKGKLSPPALDSGSGANAVMNTGLWRYSRHPNYFGESCLWWGLFLMALSAGGWWAVLSPLLITYLLLKVSGINLQEQHLHARSPAYVDYVRRTSAFMPWRPKPLLAV